MARNKEALVLLLDVGPSMHSRLPEIEKLSSMLVQKKLIYSKSDEVGVVLFGTEDTDNELTKEVGGYEHVVVLRHIRVVDVNIIDALRRLPKGTASSDFLDAIVVGMDMLIKKFGPTNKGKQRLCLITDALGPIKEPYEGTKEDQIDMISAQMKSHGMRFDCIVVRENLPGAANQTVMDENDFLLSRLSKKTAAKVIHVESATSLLGALRTRNISPVTIFRGDLELSPLMKIKVWVYKKTSEEKFPTLKQYSDKAPSTDRFATHEVKADIEYRSVQNPDKVVPPEQRIKGYRYGPQVVPISSAEWEAVKFKPEKSVKLLGFTDASNIMRHYYVKDVNVFIPEPGNTKAIIAVSSLATAMKEMNKVAILRCVWRQGQGNVVIGVLTPNLSTLDNVPDSFYFNVLPFAEDVREFQFPSFSDLPLSWQPNEQQQEAADKLVMMLDLTPSGKEEVLQPDLTPNPVLEDPDWSLSNWNFSDQYMCSWKLLFVTHTDGLAKKARKKLRKRRSLPYIVKECDIEVPFFHKRFYRFLELKSKHPDADVPPIDRTLKRIIEPDPELLAQTKSVIDDFLNQFELKENPKKNKSSKRLWREKPSASNEEKEGAEDDVSNIQSTNLITKSSLPKVEKIGNLTPVQDFEAMMQRRDSPEWVSKAMRDMEILIFNLLENSLERSNYDMAIECLGALRRGCVLEQEPKEFNQFMHTLYKKCKDWNLNHFLELLISKHITLISKEEAIDRECLQT